MNFQDTEGDKDFAKDSVLDDQKMPTDRLGHNESVNLETLRSQEYFQENEYQVPPEFFGAPIQSQIDNAVRTGVR